MLLPHYSIPRGQSAQSITLSKLSALDFFLDRCLVCMGDGVERDMDSETGLTLKACSCCDGLGLVGLPEVPADVKEWLAL
jgi:hypothetical protein